MSATKPDLFNLSKSGKYNEINSLLDDDSSIDQKAKVEMILLKYTNDWSLFQEICSNPKVPLKLVLKVLKMVGKDMSDISCRDSLEQILITERRCGVKDKVRIIEALMNALKGKKYIDLKSYLLAVVVIHRPTKKVIKALLQFGGADILYKKHMIVATHCNTTKQTVHVELMKPGEETLKPEAENIRTLEATILEIAIQSRQAYEVVQCIFRAGKEKLTSMSKRSLLQGIILEYNEPVAADIIHSLLYYGGQDLVMNITTWNESFFEDMEIFHFLNYKKDFLLEESTDAKKGKEDKKKVLGFSDIRRIMHWLLEYHGEYLVSRRYGSSGSIFHLFDYYDHKGFASVVDRIIANGSETAFAIKNENGDNCLHHLVASNKDILLKNWHIFSNHKAVVMAQNKIGQTPLHIACKMNRVDCIDALLKGGDDDYTKMKDNEGNTALHLLPKIDASASSILEKLIAVGGKQLFSIKNNANEKPANQFASNYLDDYENLLNEAVVWKQKFEQIQEHLQEKEKEFASTMKDQERIQKTQKTQIKSYQSKFDKQKIYIAKLENEKQQDEIEFSEVTRKLQQSEEENAKLQSLLDQQSASQKDIETSPSRKRPREELDCNDSESDAKRPKSPFRKFTSKVSSLFQKQVEEDTTNNIGCQDTTGNIECGEETESKTLWAQITALQSENQDLLIQLENEKKNHTKTLQRRLKGARDAVWHN